MTRFIKTATVLATALAATACSTEHAASGRTVGMPNPASAYCVKLGGQLDIVKGADGEYGLCILPGGEKIEEWALFRRDHANHS
ncbi:putative hemolysin [Frateuria aurantia]|uniref:Putative hemolysin n=1 Tax=Frateuria aurantia (strain ATCC 33424 / DSM 6220 / KCTC 2777 / LMG 1558 / NBRC 3245 / NCIMB 13370) TaxID=767434 RepID=H8L138_FRAAD|nr:DUF333 domain-containing protein [Frateuria aurantia]AFC87193.1 putative hemolysin [Frateuria aurantia DSM 6220]